MARRRFCGRRLTIKTLGMILTDSPVSNRLTAKTINSAFGRSFRRGGTVRVSALGLNQQPADRIASLSEIHEASGNGQRLPTMRLPVLSPEATSHRLIAFGYQRDAP